MTKIKAYNEYNYYKIFVKIYKDDIISMNFAEIADYALLYACSSSK